MLIGEASIKFAIGIVYILTIEDLRRILSHFQGASNGTSLMHPAHEIAIYTTALVLCLVPNVVEIVTNLTARYYWFYFTALFVSTALLQLLTTVRSIATLKMLANRTLKTLWQAYSHEVINLCVITCLFVLSDLSVVLCGMYLTQNSTTALWTYILQNIIGLAPVTYLMALHYSSFSQD